MNHSKTKHYVSVIGIVALALGLITYILYNGKVSATVVISFVAAIAGLGGYNLKQRQDTK